MVGQATTLWTTILFFNILVPTILHMNLFPNASKISASLGAPGIGFVDGLGGIVGMGSGT